MARHFEIERKFLVRSFPAGWKHRRHSRIVQGYFPLASKQLEIRLRRRGSHYCLTIKGGHGRTRLEEEIDLPEKSFLAIWPLTKAARLSKTRYQIPFSGRTIDLDVYHGRHHGLVTAEIEFSSRHQSDTFQPPPWFGREVTGNPRYANETLARRDGQEP